MRQSVSAQDIVRPAYRGIPPKVVAFAWKYARILGVSALPEFAIRDNLTSRWLGQYVHKPGQPNRIQIQKRLLHDDRSLERIIAHEMAHHADITGPGHQYDRITKGHGPRWQSFADKINRVMGVDFVTVVSDASYVLAPETKPYLLLIMRLSGGRIGYTVAMRLSGRMEQYLERHVIFFPEMKHKIMTSRDPRWSEGRPIGGRKVNLPRTPEEARDLEKLFEGSRLRRDKPGLSPTARHSGARRSLTTRLVTPPPPAPRPRRLSRSSQSGRLTADDLIREAMGVRK